MKLKRIQPGERISAIPGGTWNRFVDTAERRRDNDSDLRRRFQRKTRIRNKSGSDCNEGDILGIDKVDTDLLSSDPFGQYYRPTLVGVTPTSEHKGKFAVCLEPIPSGAFGYATTEGIALVRLASTTEQWETCDVDPTNSTQLKLVADGSARVLWFDNFGATGFETHSGDTLVTQSGDTLLDQAAGGGELTIALVRLGSPAVTISRLVAKAAEDIEHNSYGTVTYQTGNAFDDDSISATQEQVEVYNPGRKIWYGSRLIIGTTDLKDGDSDYNILSCWSASRVRGVAVNAIAPGGTGTVGTLSTIDGHFDASTIQAYLPTETVEVTADAVVWAELVYRDSVSASRWEIYSADCP